MKEAATLPRMIYNNEKLIWLQLKLFDELNKTKSSNSLNSPNDGEVAKSGVD